MSKLLVFIGRLLFAAQFFKAQGTLWGEKAILDATAKGIPFAAIAVKVSALLAFVGAISIVVGYGATIGAWLLILFLVPVSFTMHAYWTIDDPAAHAAQSISFFKNINAIGGALVLAYFGTGPLRIDDALAKTEKGSKQGGLIMPSYAI